VLGDSVQLDGSASSDPDGDPLLLQWAFVSVPAGSGLTDADIGQVNAADARFTPDVEGVYILGLGISDGQLQDTDTVTVTVTGGVTNTPPAADAGPAQTVSLGDSVLLDGSGSSDADGDPLTFLWSFDSVPATSSVTDADLADASASQTNFTPDAEGEYLLRLTVDDGTDTDVATVTITVSPPPNTAPIADAGPDQAVFLGATVQLDGTGSSDPDGDPITHRWVFSNKPVNSSLIFTDIIPVNGSTPTLVPDVVGNYILQLTVSDGTDTTIDLVTITVTAPPNTAPIADAGPAQATTLGDSVLLDGSGSSDGDGDPLTFLWSFDSVPATSSVTDADLADASASQTNFTPDAEGDYLLRLTVDDGTDTDVATVTITVSPPLNTAPVADAGPDQAVVLGATVQLDGTGSSDPDGDPISFQWVFSNKPVNSSLIFTDITPVNASTPTLVPDVTGTYVLQLTVSDGTDTSADLVVISVTTTANTAPAADAGPAQAVTAGDTVQLDGSGSSDPDGDPLSFSWSLVSPIGSSASLTGASTASPSFVADVAGTYFLVLTVDDGNLTASDSVTVIASEGNQAPVADAGQNQSVAFPSTVSLDASASSDPDNDPLSFSWSFVVIPPGSALVDSDIVDGGGGTASFIPDTLGFYFLEVTVDDGEFSDTSQVLMTVFVPGGNSPPVADAGADQVASTGDTVTLDGTGSFDPDGDPFTYDWIFFSTPAASALGNGDINDFFTSTPNFVPDVEGTFTLMLSVSDGTITNRDRVDVVVSFANSIPVADAGPDQVVSAGEPVQLDGSGSSDADGDALVYTWSLVPPGGSSASLSDPTAESPTFVADVAGSYLLVLQVSDGIESVLDAMNVTAQ
jgi:hypothetical protein